MYHFFQAQLLDGEQRRNNLLTSKLQARQRTMGDQRPSLMVAQRLQEEEWEVHEHRMTLEAKAERVRTLESLHYSSLN